jgi:methyltransferase-like protein 6
LSKDKQLVSDFKKNKLELEAKKNWDLFYRRNKANFFKDRYWTFREFDELNDDQAVNLNENGFNKLLLEIGSGVGNFLFPLIKQNRTIFVYACDFSTDAINLLKANADYDTNRCNAFVCDVTKPGSLLESLTPEVKVDIVTLIFVMSALHPNKMRDAVENIASVIKPGGVVLIRDYGIYDHSMIRFDPGHKLDEKFYARQDGTRTFFFTLEELDELFVTSSSTTNSNKQRSDYNASCVNTAAQKPLFEKLLNEYVFRETVNIKENLRVPRVFVQSKYRRTCAPI